MTVHIYKIRNPQGLFSTGGATPSWSRRGKTWVALNHLNAHLTLIRTERAKFLAGLKDTRTAQRYEAMRRLSTVDKTLDPYRGCEVIEFIMHEHSHSHKISEGVTLLL